MSPSLSVIGGLLVDGPSAVVVKATLVLASAALAAALLRRASAAIRHLIWTLALSACAALALLAPAAPTIALDIPVDAARQVAPQFRQRSLDVPVRRQDRATTVVSVGGGASIPVAISVRSAELDPAGRIRLTSAVASSLPTILFGMWIIGCVFILFRSVVGHRHIRRVTNSANPLTSAEWISALQSASLDLGFTGDVELLASNVLSAPVTSGFIRPVIILPADCALWSGERRRIVLVHEIAHIARLDYLAQLVATIACAIFWFHPAIWFASARLRAEAEHAADDRVLGAGTLGLTYATHLLDLARGDHAAPLAPAVSVGMIRSSRLEGRFRAMLDSTRSRAAVTPRFQAAAATLMLCAMIPAAGLRTVARAAPSPATVVVPVERIAGGVRPAARSLVATAIQAIDDSTFEKTIDASAGERLTLDLPTGASVVLHAWDESRIRLVARLSGRDWRDTRVDLVHAAGGVRLRSHFVTGRENRATSHRFELWVPRHTDVSMSSAGGSVAINDLAGEFTGSTGGGEITIDRARGHASISTGGGEVRVSNSELSGTVSTGGGTVEISNVTGGLRGSSGSGPVIVSGDGLATTTISGSGRGFGTGVGQATTITTRDGATITTNDATTIRTGQLGISRGGLSGVTTTNVSGQTVTTNYPGTVATTIGGVGRGFGYGYSISKAGGQIAIDDLPDGGVLNTGGGQIVVRSSGGSISAYTGGGDIELDRVAGDARVSTGAGNVQITILNSNGTERSVDVFSGKGRIVLYLPANLDARFELETAYTENFDRRTTIESDFALDRSETGEWDDRFGTPRKYVRAQGILGSGAGLIRVRTVNGDVVVRRR